MRKERIIVTTDMECDDMNSLLHLCLFLNEVDLEGMIYTSSKFHFNGDGIHTLGEVEPDYRCSGEAAWTVRPRLQGPDPEAKNLKSYRPFETGWIEKVWQNEYAQSLPYLQKNADGYPSVEDLMKITCYGNCDFEGDVREETEGSRRIVNAIFKEDPRPLHLLSWGGANTIVRVLMSIAETYQNTEQWEAIQAYVTDKVRVYGIINGIGQDNAWLKHGKALFPDLKLVRTEFGYGGYLSEMTAPADCREMFKAPWMKKYIKFSGSPLMKKYGLFGDGTVYAGEPDSYQYGLHPQIDWGFPGMPVFRFEPYDFLGEGDSTTYVPMLQNGLRGMENPRYGTIGGRMFPDGGSIDAGEDFIQGKTGKSVQQFLKAYQEEWAARTRWTFCEPEDCVHVPSVTLGESDLYAAAGETVSLQASAEDPDGRGLLHGWSVYRDGCSYHGQMKQLQVFDPLSYDTCFTIPQDAQEGEWFALLLTVRCDEEIPITRYGEVIVHVTGSGNSREEKNPLGSMSY